MYASQQSCLSSGLPALSRAGAPAAGVGQSPLFPLQPGGAMRNLARPMCWSTHLRALHWGAQSTHPSPSSARWPLLSLAPWRPQSLTSPYLQHQSSSNSLRYPFPQRHHHPHSLHLDPHTFSSSLSFSFHPHDKLIHVFTHLCSSPGWSRGGNELRTQEAKAPIGH